MFATIEKTLGSAVASGGTFTVDYPANTGAGSFAAFGHKLWVASFQALLSAPGDFTLAFGASEITVTYNGSTTIPEGGRVNIQLNKLGEDTGVVVTDYSDEIPGLAGATLGVITLGAPVAADADGVCASQAGTAATNLTINGALASGGKVELDVPRNIVAAWTGTAVLTVTGKDVFGNTIVESSASGTSLTGKKAFKEITSAQFSANTTSATVGTGDVLGLPVFLPGAAFVLAELQDGAAATAGTLVAGVSDEATATTGDVRGTYDPNAAANGARVFELLVALPDGKYKGVAQFAG